jgi:hypothetical protein
MIPPFAIAGRTWLGPCKAVKLQGRKSVVESKAATLHLLYENNTFPSTEHDKIERFVDKLTTAPNDRSLNKLETTT